jgi:hypothetical protein
MDNRRLRDFKRRGHSEKRWKPNAPPVLKLGVVDFGVETTELPSGVIVELSVIPHQAAVAIVALDADRYDRGAVPVAPRDRRHSRG